MLKWLLPVAIALLAGAGLLAAAGQGVSTTVHPLTVPGPATGTPVTQNSPCKNSDVPDGGYKHVIWIVMGTRDANDVMSPGSLASHAKSYANECGSAESYVSAAHPALPNVPAMLAGTTAGLVKNRCGPCPTVVPNLFKQVPSWKVYVGGMEGRCSSAPNRNYDPRTNPPTWVGVPESICKRRDVPLGSLSDGALTRDLKSGELPRFSMVIPGRCQSMTFVRQCGGPAQISTFVAVGDQWLGQRLDQIVASPAYKSGSTAVFVTWQSGSGAAHVDCASNPGIPTCRVPLIVVAPSVDPGTISALDLSHYSLLKTTESILGVPHLGAAAKPSTASMRVPFTL